MAAERWLLRCTHAVTSDGQPYELDFRTAQAAAYRRDLLASRRDIGVCNEPHVIIHQRWVDGRWVDIPEADLTSEDKSATMKP